MEAVADFARYIGKDWPSLQHRLADVMSELANAHIYLSSSLQAEKTAKVQGFLRSEATSVAGKERDADAQALPFTMGVLELQGQIRALTEERTFLWYLVGASNARQDRPVDQLEGLQGGDQGSRAPGSGLPTP